MHGINFEGKVWVTMNSSEILITRQTRFIPMPLHVAAIANARCGSSGVIPPALPVEAGFYFRSIVGKVARLNFPSLDFKQGCRGSVCGGSFFGLQEKKCKTCPPQTGKRDLLTFSLVVETSHTPSSTVECLFGPSISSIQALVGTEMDQQLAAAELTVEQVKAAIGRRFYRGSRIALMGWIRITVLVAGAGDEKDDLTTELEWMRGGVCHVLSVYDPDTGVQIF